MVSLDRISCAVPVTARPCAASSGANCHIYTLDWMVGSKGFSNRLVECQWWFGEATQSFIKQATSSSSAAINTDQRARCIVRVGQLPGTDRATCRRLIVLSALRLRQGQSVED